MKRFTSACLALASVGLTVAAPLAARPQYGGTLRVETDTAIRFANPASPTADARESAARARVLPLVFETLTRVGVDNQLEPWLATSWESDSAGQKWRFRLRGGVTLHDGSPLGPASVSSSLMSVENRWRITVISDDTLSIELPQPAPDLPWLLSDAGYSVIVRRPQSVTLGTGPFRLDRTTPSTATLRAHDMYREGRPFLDAIEIQMERPLGAQLADLEAGRADLVTIQAIDARRVTQRGMGIASSRPVELAALVFEPHRSGDDLAPLRRTLAAAINRESLASVLLQRHAEPAAGLLPSWLARPAAPSVPSRPATLSRPEVLALPLSQRELIVRADAADPAAQAIAERIAVDAREAGFSIKVQAPTGLAPRPDARIARVRVPATTPDRALAEVVRRLGLRQDGDLSAAVVVPVVHLAELYGTAERVLSWTARPVTPAGVWNLADVWLAGGRP